MVIPHLRDSIIISALACQLGLSMSDPIIQSNYRSHALEVFQRWLVRGKDCTWKSLIDALRYVDENRLASDLEDWLNEGN